jgi:hypothetical protein
VKRSSSINDRQIFLTPVFSCDYSAYSNDHALLDKYFGSPATHNTGIATIAESDKASGVLHGTCNSCSRRPGNEAYCLLLSSGNILPD